MCICAFALLVGGQAVAAAPQRIVSLKPNITEILFAIGVGDRVVGVTTWCDFPRAATTLPRVADYLGPNLEKVLAVRPDLAIGSRENAMRRPVERLQRAGVRVELLPFDSVAQLSASIRAIGALVETPEAADALAERLQQTFAAVARAPSARHRRRVLIVVGDRPLVAAGPRSFLGELLQSAHGNNVLTTMETAYPRPAIETLLARDPEVIIEVGDGPRTADPTWRRALAPVDAVRHRRIVAIPTALLRPGPRVTEGLEVLTHAIREAP